MNKATKDQRLSNVRNVILWVLQILTASAFLAVGLAELAGNPTMVEAFDHVSAGHQWFRFVIGLVELVSVIFLLVPRFTPIGAALLIWTMIGAVLVHQTDLGGSPMPILILLCFAAIILWGRFPTIEPGLRKLFAVAKVARADAMSREHRAAMSSGCVNLPSSSHA